MPRFFNTAGPCDPGKHFMLPPERRLPAVARLIEREPYFVVHAPRQVGKTTALRALAPELTAAGERIALLASCEAAQAAGSNVVASQEEGARSSPRKPWPEPSSRPPSGSSPAAYLDRLALDHGALLLLDARKTAPPLPERSAVEEHAAEGKRITLLRL
jgi:hypothetical protein